MVRFNKINFFIDNNLIIWQFVKLFLFLGHYRMVSFEYEARALTDMLEFVDDSSMKSDEIDKEASIDALHELIPEAVFNALFEKYAEPSGKFKDSGETLYRSKI